MSVSGRYRLPTGFRIVSGGQSGVDQAALDWAIAHGVPHGGWCPRGRRAEYGTIDCKYRLDETPTAEYLERTEWNVRDSDATVIFSFDEELIGGTKHTAEFAVERAKPWLKLLRRDEPRDLVAFLERHHVVRLNVAGPRESQAPGIGAFVSEVLDLAIDAGAGEATG
ncbi:MAG: putative molybdenum carrier protein [Betaproteobacteria bacterium]